MDEIIMRRLKHLQWLEENHDKDFQKRLAVENSKVDQPVETPTNVVLAVSDRNANDGEATDAGTATKGDQLPRDWRKEHWKTLQSMAADYAGITVANKQEALRALEIYEADFKLPPAA